MKAYRAYEVGGEGATIVFSETESQAKSVAKACDCCEDARWTDIRVNREPMADSLYKGKPEIDWYDPETRLALVRDFGWACFEPSFKNAVRFGLVEPKPHDVVFYFERLRKPAEED